MTTADPTTPCTRTEHGSGTGLLLAHGAGGGIAADFGPIMDGLPARHTVAGVDHPGSGATPTPAAPLKFDDLADQRVAAADAEGRGRTRQDSAGLGTFAVCGCSLGGAVVLRVPRGTGSGSPRSC